MKLSESTWIEDGCLYTTDIAVAVSWPMGKTDCGCEYSSGWEWQDDLDGDEWGSSEAWRIPLTVCWEIYRYREGEPWVAFWKHQTGVDPIIGTRETTDVDHLTFEALGMGQFHRRAAIVCDTAEQFRVFYDAIKPEEVRDQ